MTSRRDRIRAKVMSRVEIVAGPLDTPCHIWTGPTSGSTGRGKDYARMCLDGGTMAVHIVMWVLEHGPIPPRKQLDHRCRTRKCVNADHLEMVTHKQNQRRRDEARRFACEEIAA
ncbi:MULTISPECIES: HNH endonuclease signature motif containing protein [unclassified Bradyrhizobium]|uniref:HNH endonuclease signature motif containing protein n=1 Tax=unclassified Bradyrhizobium TaxID=2631580 RepID=UPI0028E28E5C|nr:MULTISPECIES: HNH endonuclease signature motif containing protein [unclassified Bradyrhizobium]